MLTVVGGVTLGIEPEAAARSVGGVENAAGYLALAAQQHAPHALAAEDARLSTGADVRGTNRVQMEAYQLLGFELLLGRQRRRKDSYGKQRCGETVESAGGPAIFSHLYPLTRTSTGFSRALEGLSTARFRESIGASSRDYTSPGSMGFNIPVQRVAALPRPPWIEAFG